jgi:hypothetical protein
MRLTRKRAALAALLVLLVAGGYAAWSSSEPDPDPSAYRIEWRGSDRYMFTDGRWHVWSRHATWVPLPDGWTPDTARPPR